MSASQDDSLAKCQNDHAVHSTKAGAMLQVSSVDLERVCSGAASDVADVAAVGVPPPGGGPDQLLLFVVLRAGSRLTEAALQTAFQVMRAVAPPSSADIFLWQACPSPVTSQACMRVCQEDQFPVSVSREPQPIPGWSSTFPHLLEFRCFVSIRLDLGIVARFQSCRTVWGCAGPPADCMGFHGHRRPSGRG